MAYTLKHEEKTLEGNSSYANEDGKHHCAVFVQRAASAPGTSNWKQGIKVMEAARGGIAVGTVIATFDENGKYPASQRHAAIYLSHDDKGVAVYDQWVGQDKVKKRVIRNKKGAKRNVNDAAWYHVVE